MGGNYDDDPLIIIYISNHLFVDVATLNPCLSTDKLFDPLIGSTVRTKSFQGFRRDYVYHCMAPKV